MDPTEGRTDLKEKRQKSGLTESINGVQGRNSISVMPRPREQKRKPNSRVCYVTFFRCHGNSMANFVNVCPWSCYRITANNIITLISPWRCIPEAGVHQKIGANS